MNKMTTPPASAASLSRAVGVAGHLRDSRLDAALGEHGLSIAKLGVLRLLVQADQPVALGQLAARQACVKSNITQLVDRLEEDGLVKRTPALDDRRSMCAAITDKGRRLYELGVTVEGEVERQLLEALSPKEREQLARLLTKFGGVQREG
jgi:DNA-binding MarR family transcriptional regulator